MSDKRKQSKAQREIEETKILVDYLEEHRLSYDALENFSEDAVRAALEWHQGRIEKA